MSATAAVVICGAPLAALAANATPAPAPNYQSQACPPGQTPQAGFTDISGDVFAGQINCIAAYGITHGVTATTYDPGGLVPRAQMAVYLYNLAATSNKGAPSGSAPCGFTDISNWPQTMQNDICADKAAGITNGTDATHFSPSVYVPRDQMAAFIHRTLAYEGLTITAPAGSDYFNDDNGDFAEPDINALASVGIVQGTATGTYSPTYVTQRDQMAVYMARSLEYAIEQGVAVSRYSLTVSPSTDQIVAPGGSVTYTVTPLSSGEKVTLELFNCANVTTGSSGTTYAVNSSDNTANPGTVSHDVISSVDGTSTSATEVVATSGGSSMTFTVQNDGTPECVVPVAFLDQNGNGKLDVSSQGYPDEPAAAGGRAYFANQAPNGAISPTSSSTVMNPTSNSFDQGGATYFYNSGDTYQLYYDSSSSCKSDSYSDFQARLSTGDQVTGSYVQKGSNGTSSTPSTFCLHDTAPLPPAQVNVAKDATNGGLDITWPASQTPNVVAYQVYRATATPPGTSGPSYTCPQYNVGSGAPAPAPGQSPQTPPDPKTWTLIAKVQSSGQSSYTYNDAQANGSANALQADQYCYVVSSVAKIGQVGTGREATQNASGGVAGAATPSGAQPPQYAALQQVSQSTYKVVFNEQINCATVERGDFLASFTTPSSNSGSPATVTAATPCDQNGSYTSGTLGTSTVSNVGEVTITLGQDVPAGGTLTVSSAVGSDGNTVCAANSTTVCQQAGQAISTQVSPTAPAFQGNASLPSDTTVVTTYNEYIDPGSVDAGDFKVTSGSGSSAVSVPVATATGKDNTVTLTLGGAVQPGSTVTVAAQSGSDHNTVCTPTEPLSSNCQAAGNSTTGTAPAGGPKFTGATQEVGTPAAFDLTYNEPIVCSSVNGSDYSIGTASSPTTGYTGFDPSIYPYSAACKSPTNGTSQTVVVTFTNRLPNYGYYQFTAQIGGDGNTVLDGSSLQQAPGDHVATSSPAGPRFQSASFVAGQTDQVQVTYNESVSCASVDLDGSDFTGYATRSDGTTVTTPFTSATCSGNTVVLTIGNGPFVTGEQETIKAQQGTDKDTVLDQSGAAQPVGDTVTTTTAFGA